MTQVTKAQFYSIMGPLDVHPRPYGRYDNAAGDYFTEWKAPSGAILGTSFGETYQVRDDLAGKPEGQE